MKIAKQILTLCEEKIPFKLTPEAFYYPTQTVINAKSGIVATTYRGSDIDKYPAIESEWKVSGLSGSTFNVDFVNHLDLGNGVQIYQYVFDNGSVAYKMFDGKKEVYKYDRGVRDWAFKDLEKAFKKLKKIPMLDVEGEEAKAPTSDDHWKSYIKDEKGRTLLAKAIAIIEEAEKAGIIYNTDFEDAKAILKRRFWDSKDAAFEDAEKQTKSSDGTLRALFFGLSDDIAKAFKLATEAKTPAAKYALESFIKPMNDLYQRLMALKPKIQKGRKPNPNKKDKPEIMIPPAASKDIEKIKELYEELLKEWYPAQVESLSKYYLETIESIKKFFEETKGDKEARQKGLRYLDAEVISVFFERKENVLAVKKDVKTLIKKYAEKSAKEIQEQFIHKNLRKITAIVAGKGDFKDVKLIRVSKSSGMLEGEVGFEFNDGSRFTVKSQVVSVYNSRARSQATTYFVRFPTTFHNVTMPDGKKYGGRSELEMVRDFAGIKQ